MVQTDWFKQLCDDIVSLRIQGAEAIARAAVEGLARSVVEGRDLQKDAERLVATRPTEPMLRNATAYFLAHAATTHPEELKEHILSHLDEVDNKIVAYAAELIKDGKCYFTHCHSNTVVKTFLAAKAQGKRFSVHNTETRPKFQGRKTATELAAAGISVVHAVDSATRINLKGCSAVFLGADALLADAKVANKIGSEMIAELAYNRNIPVYILASSWKYEERQAKGYAETLEKRDPSEVWERPPAGVEVRNDAFELVKPEFLKAIITEHGINDPATAIREIRNRRSHRNLDGKKQ